MGPLAIRASGVPAPRMSDHRGLPQLGGGVPNSSLRRPGTPGGVVRYLALTTWVLAILSIQPCFLGSKAAQM
jgi:hypothetical protein